MKQKTQKVKVSKIKKESEFYDLKELLVLVGQKLHGDEWVFEKCSQMDDPDYMKYVGTLQTGVALIENHFFEVIKPDGEILEKGEKIIFFDEQEQIANGFKIPKDQVDYALEKRTRYKDRDNLKFPRITNYFAYFGRASGRIVVPEFNENQFIQIRDSLEIQNFDEWFKAKTLSEDEVYLVMLGINPEYYLRTL